jgi:serine/threonine-protein kinase
MRAIGLAALAPLIGVLRGCLDRGEVDGPVVEDLLLSLPSGPNDAAGSVVAEFLRTGSADTSGIALFALAGLWGERARPLLLGALNHVASGVVVAAITGLRVLRAIDAHVVARLDSILTPSTPMTEEARVAAAVALAEATPEARRAAATVAMRAFSPPRAKLWSTPPPSASRDLSVALARSLLTLGAPNGAALIEQVASTSPELLRRELTSLLAQRV